MLRRKLFSGKQKTKTCQSLELLLGDVFPRDNELGTICRNCLEHNETVTKKIFQVRANFSGPKGSIGNNLQSSVVVKRSTKVERAEVPEQGAIGRRASTKRRALFASEVDPKPKPLLKTRDARTQTKPQLANTEEKSSSVDVSNFLTFEIFHDCVVRPDLPLANQNDSKDFG